MTVCTKFQSYLSTLYTVCCTGLHACLFVIILRLQCYREYLGSVEIFFHGTKASQQSLVRSKHPPTQWNLRRRQMKIILKIVPKNLVNHEGTLSSAKNGFKWVLLNKPDLDISFSACPDWPHLRPWQELLSWELLVIRAAVLLDYYLTYIINRYHWNHTTQASSAPMPSPGY